MSRMRRSSGPILLLASLGVVGVLAWAGGGSGAAAGEGHPLRKVAVEGGGRYTDVSATALARMLLKKDFVLVNVHVPPAGEIAGTDLDVPFDRIEANLAKFPADKKTRLVLYCRSGMMSRIAARTLVNEGFTDVWNLEGGMIAWQEAGYPLTRTTKP